MARFDKDQSPKWIELASKELECLGRLLGQAGPSINVHQHSHSLNVTAEAVADMFRPMDAGSYAELVASKALPPTRSEEHPQPLPVFWGCRKPRTSPVIRQMNLIGYARCSTTKQDTEAQLDALSQQGCDQIFSEYISGAAPYAERVELQKAIAACSQGDVLVVPKLDRLGRSMDDCVSRVAELLDAGIHVKTLDDRVDTKGLGKMAKLVVGILAAAAEIERDLILERTDEGRRRAMDAGVKFGRKRSWTAEQAETVREFRAQQLSYGAIAKKLNISTSKVRRILAAN